MGYQPFIWYSNPNLSVCQFIYDNKHTKFSRIGDTTLDAVAIEDKMDCVGKSKTYSVKTKRDENGTHPAWMSKRKIQNLKSKPKSKTAKSIDGSGRVVKKRRAGKMKGKKYT